MREGTRNGMREKMRRRSKRGPNNSEATGKIGQEIPADQPAALRPSYPDMPKPSDADLDDDNENRAASLEAAVASADHDADAGEDASLVEAAPLENGFDDSPVDDGKPGAIELETQPETLSQPPAAPHVVAAGDENKPAPKGFVVLAIGLPGSGKTTWFKRRAVTPLSSDLLRTILFDDITDQRYSGLVFSTLRSLLRARLIAKMPWNYVDATNLSAHERRQWIKMARSFGYEAQAVYFDVPLSVCMERNSRRDRRVADDVMQKMAERLRPPSFREGFSKITVVRVKGQPGATQAATAEPTAESFNTPVPAEPEEAMPIDLDEPNGNFDDAPQGREQHLRENGGMEGRQGSLSSPEVGPEDVGESLDDLDEPSGRLSTLGGNGAGEAHDAAGVRADQDDQPDTYE